METNLIACPKRSLFRRLLWPVGMAVTVIGASAGGAYWCMNGTAEVQNPLRAHSAKDQLKDLFADEQSKTKLNREAQELFGGSSAGESTKVEAPAPVNTSVLGDRYGNYTPSPVMPPLETEAKPPIEEVTRGQEPDVNPLRVIARHKRTTSRRRSRNFSSQRKLCGCSRNIQQGRNCSGVLADCYASRHLSPLKPSKARSKACRRWSNPSLPRQTAIRSLRRRSQQSSDRYASLPANPRSPLLT